MTDAVPESVTDAWRAHIADDPDGSDVVDMPGVVRGSDHPGVVEVSDHPDMVGGPHERSSPPSSTPGMPAPVGSMAEDELVDADRSGRLVAQDLWLAFLGGERVWIDGDVRPTLIERFAALLVCVVLSFHVVILWTVLPGQLDIVADRSVVWIATVAGTVAAFSLWLRPFRITFGNLTGPARLGWRATWRALAFGALVTSIILVTPGWMILISWTIGVIGGADAYLTTRALGIVASPWRWWRRFMVSFAHFGIIGAVAAAFVTGPAPDPTIRVLGLYAALQASILLACLTIITLDAFRKLQDAERDVVRTRFRERERQHRIHWLHDDVLSEVRITALRVRRDGATADHAARELDELDHRLRLRQLDEIYLGGPVRLAEVMQPHLRRVQSVGVDLVAVPSLDVMGRRVDELFGRRFGRAVAVFTSNAVNAGATSMAIEVHVDDHAIELCVTDDAGGFDLDAIPPGRGLHQLMDDLGPGRVHCTPSENGSIMTATIPLRPDHPDGDRADPFDRPRTDSPEDLT